MGKTRSLLLDMSPIRATMMAFPTNIRIKWKRMAVANTLLYCDKNTAIKSFIVQTLGKYDNKSISVLTLAPWPRHQNKWLFLFIVSSILKSDRFVTQLCLLFWLIGTSVLLTWSPGDVIFAQLA
jgi:hypothetical protein